MVDTLGHFNMILEYLLTMRQWCFILQISSVHRDAERICMLSLLQVLAMGLLMSLCDRPRSGNMMALQKRLVPEPFRGTHGSQEGSTT